MRLNDELRRELERRLSTIEKEHASDPAFKKLPVADELALRILFIVAVVVFLLL
jgi:hypothetical protein